MAHGRAPEQVHEIKMTLEAAEVDRTWDRECWLSLLRAVKFLLLATEPAGDTDTLAALEALRAELHLATRAAADLASSVAEHTQAMLPRSVHTQAMLPRSSSLGGITLGNRKQVDVAKVPVDLQDADALWRQRVQKAIGEFYRCST